MVSLMTLHTPGVCAGPALVLAIVLAGAIAGCAGPGVGAGQHSATLGGPVAAANGAISAPIGRAGAAGVPARQRIIQVKPGQTLLDISRAHNVSITQLMRDNGLKDPNLFPGMRLIVR